MNNYNLLKNCSREELDALVPKGFMFKTHPWKQQLAAFIACIANDGFLINLDLGTGKTKVAIDFFRFVQSNSKKKLKILVVCLNNAIEKWADEVALHSGMKSVCMRADTNGKWQLLNGSGFFIVNFEGLLYMMTRNIKHDGKGKQAIDYGLIKKLLLFGFDGIVVDESHKIKNVRSLTYKIIRDISKAIPYRLNLTGTVFGSTLLDIWSQYYVVDKGETYGSNFFQFRSKHFKDKGFFGPDYKVTKDGEQFIRSRLWNRAIRYSEDEVDDLPESVYEEVKFELGQDQRIEYDKLAENQSYHSAIKNKYMAFRQICSGFIYATEKEFKSNPKLLMLEGIIDEVIQQGSKAVVFHEFIKEFEMISSMFKKKKIKFSALNSSIKGAEKSNQIKQFEMHPKCKVMIAHPLSGGSSIDLVAAAYCVFYSNGGNIIDRRQCEKRINRGGQKSSRVFYFDLVAKQTIEEKILKNLKRGKDAFDEIIDGRTFRNALYGR